MRVWRINIPLFLLAGFIFGIKTYIVYRFFLQVEIDSILQELIILLNPFVTSMIFFGLSVWLSTPQKQEKFIRYGALLGAIIIYLNLLFYRSFTDFITIPQLFQMSNLTDLSTSILSLIKFYDVFLFIDVIIIWILCKKTGLNTLKVYGKRSKIFALVISLLLLSGNFLLAEMERPQLLSRGFDREYLVKNIGLFYFHVYDVVVQSKMRTQRVLADDSDILSIKKYINDEVRSNQKSELFGVAENRNVIFISAESVQTFVINNQLHGDDISLFLNIIIYDAYYLYL